MDYNKNYDIRLQTTKVAVKKQMMSKELHLKLLLENTLNYKRCWLSLDLKHRASVVDIFFGLDRCFFIISYDNIVVIENNFSNSEHERHTKFTGRKMKSIQIIEVECLMQFLISKGVYILAIILLLWDQRQCWSWRGKI